MVELNADTTVEQGVTFVQATVTNTRGTAQVIRLASQLAGPTWHPQYGTVSAPQWDGDRWESALQPGESRGVGFASPTTPSDPPIAVVDIRRATPADFENDAGAVLRDLDEWRPPRDIVRNRQ
ncbi:Uncharacterized protein SVXHr_1535 [Halorhabdus sp. SVX81]|nr:Uncharacterized protein SVXHr_1535 [Halorhabdus sp. SVX81]